MNTNKKLIIFFLLIFILGLGLSHLMPSEKKIGNTTTGLRIGSGDDITGLLLEHIIKASKDMRIESIDATEENEDVFYDFTFKDC